MQDASSPVCGVATRVRCKSHQVRSTGSMQALALADRLRWGLLMSDAGPCARVITPGGDRAKSLAHLPRTHLCRSAWCYGVYKGAWLQAAYRRGGPHVAHFLVGPVRVHPMLGRLPILVRLLARHLERLGRDLARKGYAQQKLRACPEALQSQKVEADPSVAM